MVHVVCLVHMTCRDERGMRRVCGVCEMCIDSGVGMRRLDFGFTNPSIRYCSHL